VSAPDDGFYRGDPMPTDSGSTHHDRPPASGPPPTHGPPPTYGPPPGYGPVPGYGAPGYGPPAYGPPGFAPRRPTNGLAIGALVSIFVFPPIALVLGLLARQQIRRTGEEGDGIALAAVIVGGLAVAGFVAFLLFWIVAIASLTDFG
jgi:hypothetical protein